MSPPLAMIVLLMLAEESGKPGAVGGGLIGILAGGGLALVGKWLQRRDAKAREKALKDKESESTSATIEGMYLAGAQGLIQTLREERDQLRCEMEEQITKLRTQYDVLRAEHDDCARRFAQLMVEFENLKRQVNGHSKSSV